MKGFNATIFVYGQTGSGKTHTMEGYEYAMAETRNAEGVRVKMMSPLLTAENNVGIALRTIKEFFKQRERIREQLKGRFLFYVSFYQIYNEQVYDLLNFESSVVGEGGRRRFIKQKELKVRYTGKD